MTEQSIKNRYFELLAAYVAEPEESYLLATADLGRELVLADVPPEDIASTPLLELLMAYGLAFRERLEFRERAVEALRKSEERYRTVVEYQTDLICRFLPDGTLTFVNQAYCLYHGQQREELIGHSFMPLVLPEDREKVAQHLASFSREKPVATIDHRAVVAGGKVRWQQWINRPIFDEQGNVTEFQAVGHDITKRVRSEEERARAEEALRESEEKYRSLIEQSNDAIYLLYENRFEIINPRFAELFGIAPEEANAPDLDFMTLVAPKSRPMIQERMKKLTEGQELALRFEFTALDKAGNEIEVDVSTSYVSYRGGTAIQGILRDITGRKKMEQQLRQQERLAAVGQLAGGIAHDFNNMLTVILLYAHQLLRQEQAPASTVSAAEVIIKESQRASKLVGQILDFSRRSPLEISQMNLKPFIKEAVRILERTIPENIHLHLDVGAEECVVKGDPTRIQQVLMNLATNGRDAMPEGGELRFELARMELRPDDAPPVAGMSPGEWIRLSVSDTGTGIPPHVLPHLFEPFFTTKGPDQGTGLGLAQVHGIVAQHGGHIGVETAMGQGTTFRVYLPASGAQEQVVEEKTSAPPRGRGETILLVEDNENLREGGRKLLEPLGYRVLTGANGREALEVCQVVKGIDLVITDLVMPEMGGERLMQELRKATPDLKVLAITGYAMEKNREELKDAGFLDVVYKPFDVDVLAQIIRRALDE